MLTTQKKIWYFLFFVFVVAIVIWLTLPPPSSQNMVIQPESDKKEEKHVFSNVEDQKVTASKENEKHLKIDNTPTKVNLQEENSNKYMEHLLELEKQRIKDPRTVLKMESLPEKDQIQLKKWLSTYKKQGYISSDDSAFDSTELQESEASFLNLNDPDIVVSLQDTKNTSFAKYKYLGAVLDEQGDIETLHRENYHTTGVKRLYTDDNGMAISLHEVAINSSDSGTLLIDKFVSNEVQGYPVTIMKFCTPNARCVTKLTLMTSDKRYEISIKDDKNSKSDEYLLEMASSLDLPKLPKLPKQQM